MIPLKAKAFLDLVARMEAGESIDSRSIKKHRNDVFRLLQLLPQDSRIEFADAIRSDLQRFVECIESGPAVDPKDFSVQMTQSEGIALIRSAYSLS